MYKDWLEAIASNRDLKFVVKSGQGKIRNLKIPPCPLHHCASLSDFAPAFGFTRYAQLLGSDFVQKTAVMTLIVE